MNEWIKTGIYVTLALAVIVGAVVSYPKEEEFKLPDLVGKPLFAEFADPDAAAELDILEFREDVGRISEFEVARDPETGLWVIPSSADYPADAQARVRDAATSLIDLEVLGEVSKSASDHEMWGVVEPKEQMDAAQSGVGLLVRVKDEKGDNLAELIVGKRRKGTRYQHFVRKPGIDTTYLVRIDPTRFPTDFEKWIERDLLRLNPLDVERIILKDYSTIKNQTPNGLRGTINRRFEADITRDIEQNKWILNKLLHYKNNEAEETELLDTEELNATRLEQLVAALDEMRIVGVMRKPPGLGADLKAGKEFTDNQESLLSLTGRGFYLIGFGEEEPELHAANGELAVSLRNGVQYVLRFGEIADVARESEEGKLSRYLFVTVQLDESKFPPLELKPLPGGDGETDDGMSAAEKADLDLRRERIRRENQRLKDEREEKLNEARQMIAALNARFADWYYIIPEDQYKEVHLRRNDLIRESEAAREEGFGIDAFRQLQQEGLRELPKKEDQERRKSN